MLHYVNKLEPGSLFGEMALQSHRPRNATVIVGPQAATLAILNKYDFETHLAAGLQKETEERLIFFLSSVFKDSLHPGLVKRLGYDFLRSEEKLDKGKSKFSHPNPNENRVYVVMSGLVILESLKEPSSNTSVLPRTRNKSPTNKTVFGRKPGSETTVGVSEVTLGNADIRDAFKPRNYKNYGSKPRNQLNENSEESFDSVDHSDEDKQQQPDVIGHDGNLFRRQPPNTQWSMARLGTGEIIGLSEAVEGKNWSFKLTAVTDASLTSVSAEVIKAYVVANPQLATFVQKHMMHQHLATKEVYRSRINATNTKAKIALFDRRVEKVHRAKERAVQIQQTGVLGSKQLQQQVVSSYTHQKPEIVKVYDQVPQEVWKAQEREFTKLLDANHSLFFLGMIRKGALLVRVKKEKRFLNPSLQKGIFNHSRDKSRKTHDRGSEASRSFKQHERSVSTDAREGSIYLEYSFDPTDESTFLEHNKSEHMRKDSILVENSEQTQRRSQNKENSSVEHSISASSSQKDRIRAGGHKNKLYMPSGILNQEKIKSLLTDQNHAHSKMTQKMRHQLARNLVSNSQDPNRQSPLMSKSLVANDIATIDRSFKHDANSSGIMYHPTRQEDDGKSGSKPDHNESTCFTEQSAYTKPRGIDRTDRSYETVGDVSVAKSADWKRNKIEKVHFDSVVHGMSDRLKHYSEDTDSRILPDSAILPPKVSPILKQKHRPMLRKQHTLDAVPTFWSSVLPRIAGLSQEAKPRGGSTEVQHKSADQLPSVLKCSTSLRKSQQHQRLTPAELNYRDVTTRRIKLADAKFRQLMLVNKMTHS